MISPSERMIAQKDGAIGWMIFNNPERRNARVARHVAGDPGDPRPFRARPRGAGDRAPGRRRQGVRLRRRHLAVRAAALLARDHRAVRRHRRGRQYPAAGHPQADHRHDPRLLHRRRRRRGVAMRPAHRRRQCALRHAGGAARPGLSLGRGQEAGRSGRPGLRQGDLLHRAPVRRRRGARHGARQPRPARGRARALCARLLRA